MRHEQIVERIRKELRLRRWTLSGLARRIGLSGRELSSYVGCFSRFPPDVLDRIRKVLVLDLPPPTPSLWDEKPTFLPTAAEIMFRLKFVLMVGTDKALAEALGYSPQTLSGWKRRNFIPTDVCCRVAMQTGASLDFILMGSIGDLVPILRIDEALFQDCWEVASEFQTSPFEIRELALRTYNARVGLMGGLHGHLTVEDIAAALDASLQIGVECWK